MAVLIDYKVDKPTEEEDAKLDHFPPEKYFCQPIAQSLSKVVGNSTQLPFLPSSHYHSHDFGMTNQNDILVIVGEVLSGNCFDCEYDKCLLGLGRCLSVYETGISFISLAEKSVVSYTRFSVKKDTNDKEYPFLDINRVEVGVTSYQNEYHLYIDQILNVLEVCSIAFCEHPGNAHVMPTNHPAINPSHAIRQFDYQKNRQIDMPGVYWGYNAGYMKHEAKGLYSSYIKGWNNNGMLSEAVDHEVTNTDLLALPDDTTEKDTTVKKDGEDPNDPNTAVANYSLMSDDLVALLNMSPDTNGPYPQQEIKRTGIIIPERMSKFCVQCEPNFNPIDSDEEEGGKRDSGAVIL